MRRFSGLALLPFVSLIIPAVLLPVLARLTSETEIAALGVGDSVGAMAALVVAFGWPLVGPARVARTGARSALVAYGESIAPRILLLLVLVPVGAVVAALLAPPEQRLLAILATVAGGVMGLSPAWFLIGRSDPGGLARYETLPRAAAGLISVALVAATGNAFWYPLSMLVLTLAFQVLHWIRSGAFAWLSRGSSWRRARRSLGAQTAPALALVSGGLYSAGTVVLVAIPAGAGVVAAYSLADRLFKASLTAIVAAANAVQGWVSEQDDHATLAARARRATLVLTIVGFVGAAGISLLGPWATELLFAAKFRIDTPTAVAFGIAFLAVALSTALGRLVLVPFGRIAFVTVSTVVGAVFGVVAIIAGTALWGVFGAAAGFAASEVVVTAVQAVGVLRLRSSLRSQAS